MARFVRLRDRPDTAEAAVVVIDRVKGRGLGRLLFERLVAAAVEREVARFRCEVLASNQSMRNLLFEMAPAAQMEAEDEVIAIEWDLPKEIVGTPAEQPWRNNPIYRVLVLAAQGGLVVLRRLLHAADNHSAPQP